ncbi:MAG: aminoglycoside 6-adenylyltransferase [Ginsengibacter sp.]
MRNEANILAEILQWSLANKNLKAIILTSSRANPNASPDLLSDYDIELIVSSLKIFTGDKWVSEFGDVIASINEERPGWLTQLVLYSHGVRIDFQVHTKSHFLKSLKQNPLPTHWDIGYKILLDKDNMLESLPAPTRLIYNINKPSPETFAKLINDFWWDTTYVAKSLWRDELAYAKYMADSIIRDGYVNTMLEWYIGLQNNWSVNTNKHGRWFKKYLDKKSWKEFQYIFSDADTGRNWQALFATCRMFGRIAKEVATALQYSYPYELERNITSYLRKIRRLKKGAISF